MKRAILFVTITAVCGAQTTVNGGRDYKGTLRASGSVSAVDFSGPEAALAAVRLAEGDLVRAGRITAAPTYVTADGELSVAATVAAEDQT